MLFQFENECLILSFYNFCFIYFKLLLIYKESMEDMVVIVVTGGFALINNNKITILVSEAELGSVRFIYRYQIIIFLTLRI